MRRDGVPGAAVIDSNQIVTAALGIRDEVPVQKDQSDARFVEDPGDGLVECVLPRSQFQRGEEDAGHLPRHKLPAGLRSLLFDMGRVA